MANQPMQPPSLAPASAAPPASAASVQPDDVHPVFGPGPVAAISGENGLYPNPAGEKGHEAMGNAIAALGLKAEPTRGKYGAHEPSWLVYGASIPQLQDLGKRFGQESVAVRMNGRNFFLYTNGPKEGQVTRPTEGVEHYQSEPEDYYTVLPGPQGEPRGYFQWNTDFDNTVPLHQLDQHLNQVTPTHAAQAILKSVVDAYHGILLDLRNRELAKAEGKRASPGCGGKCSTCGKGFSNASLPHTCTDCKKPIHDAFTSGSACSMSDSAGNHCASCAEQKGLKKADVGLQVAPHREPGIHEPSGRPHQEPGIHERPAQTSQPEKSMMKSTKVFDLVKSQVMAKAIDVPKVDAAYQEKRAEQSRAFGRCEKCGRGHKTGDHATVSLFEDPEPKVLHPSDKRVRKDEPGAQQPATASATTIEGHGGVQTPKKCDFPGRKLPDANGDILAVLRSKQSGVLDPQKGKSIAGSTMEQSAPQDETSAVPMEKSAMPPGVKNPLEKSAMPPGVKNPLDKTSMEKSALPPGGNPLDKQETHAAKMARANGGAVRVMKSEQSLKLVSMLKSEVQDTHHIVPDAKGIKRIPAPGSGGTKVLGKKFGKDEMDGGFEQPSCPACGGEGGYLGQLGSRHHFSCRGCGMQFSHVESEPKQEGKKAGKSVKKAEPGAVQPPKPPAPGGKPQAQAKPPALKPAGIPSAPKPPAAPGMTKGAMSMGPNQPAKPPNQPAPGAAFRPASPGAAGARPGMKSPAMLTRIQPPNHQPPQPGAMPPTAK
jgi:hypothetical protein